MVGWSGFSLEPPGTDAADEDFDESDDPLGWEETPQAHNPFRHVSRNDPCPCGSGKKFKRCCLV